MESTYNFRFDQLNNRQEYDEVEKYFSFLDELYETKFKLLTSSIGEKKSMSNWLFWGANCVVLDFEPKQLVMM